MYFDFKGTLIKEKKPNAKKATTYFVKRIVDDDWDVDTLNTFSNKLAGYFVNIKEYIDAYKQPDLPENNPDNDEKMDTASRPNDIVSSQKKTQSNILENDVVLPTVNYLLNDAEFNINGGMILPTTSNQKSINRTPLSSVNDQETQHIRTPTTIERCHLSTQSENHAHSASSALSPQSILSILASDKSPTKPAQKRLRFELNNDE